jgi:hypothetical protein
MAEFVLKNINFDVEIPGEPISEKVLSDLEAKLGTRLPSQLRSYYLRWNGGLPCPSTIPMNKSVWVRLYWKRGAEAARVGPAANLQSLFEVNSSPDTDFLRIWNDFKQHIPQDVLCFARNPGGSLFLVGIKDNNLGKIYFWHCDYQADIGTGELSGYDNIADVANSFVEFLLALREEPDEKESLEDWVRRVYVQ